MLTFNADVVEQGLAELLSQFAHAQNLRNVMTVILEQCQKLESSTYDLFWSRTLDGAQGAQLDVYGRVVDEPRDGLGDNDYRRFIRVRLLVLYAQGEAARLRLIVARAAGAVDVHYMNAPPASYVLRYTVAQPLTPAIQRRILRAVEAATPSGVGFLVVESIVNKAFGFDDDDDALGFDDDGELAEEIG